MKKIMSISNSLLTNSTNYFHRRAAVLARRDMELHADLYQHSLSLCDKICR
jgi:hypothetical protein